MSSSSKDEIFESLKKRQAIDARKYADDPAYKEKIDALVLKIKESSETKRAQVLNFIDLETKSRSPKGSALELHEVVSRIDWLADQWNWSELAGLDQRLERLRRSTQPPFSSLVRATRNFTIDKSWQFFLSYTFLSILLAPLASYLLSLFVRLAQQNNSGLSNSTDYNDIVTGVVSAALALPLFATNKFIKTRRRPALNPKLAPLLITSAITVAFVYLYSYVHFITSGGVSVPEFLQVCKHAAATRWLFPLPIVVIVLNFIIYARFVYISQDVADFFNDPDTGGYIKFAATAAIAIAVSAIIRLVIKLIAFVF